MSSAPPTVEEMVAQAFAISKMTDPELDTSARHFVGNVRLLESSRRIELIARLMSDKYKPAAIIKALREAAILEQENQDAQRLMKCLETLDRNTRLLTWVMIALTVVGIAVAVAGAWDGIVRLF